MSQVQSADKQPRECSFVHWPEMNKRWGKMWCLSYGSKISGTSQRQYFSILWFANLSEDKQNNRASLIESVFWVTIRISFLPLQRGFHCVFLLILQHKTSNFTFSRSNTLTVFNFSCYLLIGRLFQYFKCSVKSQKTCCYQAHTLVSCVEMAKSVEKYQNSCVNKETNLWLYSLCALWVLRVCFSFLKDFQEGDTGNVVHFLTKHICICLFFGHN